ncbi:hypothetical protein EUGRSUZ_H02393 [Eucalyptus grandis]|uniref:Uncharacterized protein n=2 Tax=Eucalyptus grandis TaxID=71139 RepID=A0ACC3JRL1_EUCGR|nr:hypothetical protein EUGRSUZ_H02393 [Eucalyptus grandis]
MRRQHQLPYLPNSRKSVQNFLNGFSTGVETYQRNHELIISLTISKESHSNSSDFIEEASQDVRTSHATLRTMIDEIADLGEEETLVEKQLTEIEKRLADVHHQRKLKHAKMFRADEILGQHTAFLKASKKEEHDRLSATRAERCCIKRTFGIFYTHKIYLANEVTSCLLIFLNVYVDLGNLHWSPS